MIHTDGKPTIANYGSLPGDASCDEEMLEARAKDFIARHGSERRALQAVVRAEINGLNAEARARVERAAHDLAKMWNVTLDEAVRALTQALTPPLSARAAEFSDDPALD